MNNNVEIINNYICDYYNKQSQEYLTNIDNIVCEYEKKLEKFENKDSKIYESIKFDDAIMSEIKYIENNIYYHSDNRLKLITYI